MVERPVHARTLPVISVIQGVRRRAASLVPRYRDRGAGLPPDRATQEELSGELIPPPRHPGSPPAAGTVVPFPSCMVQQKKHKALLRKSSPSMHRAPGRQTPLCSNKDPCRVSRAPPRAAWRGAKHAVLQSYVCTIPRATKTDSIPSWKGRCPFWCRMGHARVHVVDRSLAPLLSSSKSTRLCRIFCRVLCL